MWNICFREYDSNGNLTGLVSCRSEKIKSKSRTIRAFMTACKPGCIREIQFRKNGKQFPSMVTNGVDTKYAEPICAKLPLFEYAKNMNIEV